MASIISSSDALYYLMEHIRIEQLSLAPLDHGPTSLTGSVDLLEVEVGIGYVLVHLKRFSFSSISISSSPV